MVVGTSAVQLKLYVITALIGFYELKIMIWINRRRGYISDLPTDFTSNRIVRIPLRLRINGKVGELN